MNYNCWLGKTRPVQRTATLYTFFLLGAKLYPIQNSFSLEMAQLFLILCFILTIFISMATSLNDQGLALLSFKQSLQNPKDNSVLTNWNSSDSNPCFWLGITCNKDLRVVSIRLPNKNLSGSSDYLYLLELFLLTDWKKDLASGAEPN